MLIWPVLGVWWDQKEADLSEGSAQQNWVSSYLPSGCGGYVPQHHPHQQTTGTIQFSAYRLVLKLLISL